MKRAAAILAVVTLAGLAPPPARDAAGAAPEEYAMTTYYVGLLFRGPAWTPERTPEVEAIQEGHMANIRRLADEGKLLLAGPFTDGGDLRGMFVFQVGSMEEARALVDTDPAVKAGRLRVEIHPWYSARGIRIDRAAGAKAP
jgi:uncharacterized protein YciI